MDRTPERYTGSRPCHPGQRTSSRHSGQAASCRHWPLRCLKPPRHFPRQMCSAARAAGEKSHCPGCDNRQQFAAHPAAGSRAASDRAIRETSRVHTAQNDRGCTRPSRGAHHVRQPP
eukprot:1615954-Prymnesium_polylepis.2